MQLWDDCLQEIVIEDTKARLERQFAEKVLKVLQNTPYKQAEEEKIIQLFAHYPLYTHAEEWEQQAWQLLRTAKHPFVQSVGASILNKIGGKTQAQLMAALKDSINAFEAQANKTEADYKRFILQHNNSCVLLIAARQNVLDFYFVVQKLQSNDLFIIFMNLIDLRDLRDLFLNKYQALLQKELPTLHAKARTSLQKMQALSDEEVLHYFPNTSAKDLVVYRGFS